MFCICLPSWMCLWHLGVILDKGTIASALTDWRSTGLERNASKCCGIWLVSFCHIWPASLGRLARCSREEAVNQPPYPKSGALSSLITHHFTLLNSFRCTLRRAHTQKRTSQDKPSAKWTTEKAISESRSLQITQVLLIKPYKIHVNYQKYQSWVWQQINSWNCGAHCDRFPTIKMS